LPLIDEDAILEELVEQRGPGDAEWRRARSRESDRLFQPLASAASGAVLDSFRHLPGMPPDSGTPTSWLRKVTSVVNLRCICPARAAAERFVRRARHSGHRDPFTFDEFSAGIETQAPFRIARHTSRR